MFSSSSGAAKLALAVVIGLIVLKTIVAVATDSISIAAQAVDSFLDLFAVTVTVFAVGMANTPADKEHPFGHGKVEGLASTLQALLILAAGALIIYSAVQRIIAGTTLKMTDAGIGVMVVSIIASIFLSRHLLKVSRATGSTALEANARNIAADVYSAAGVIVALVTVRFTGISTFDPIVAVAVALFILKAGYDVMRQSFGELVDVRLPEEEEKIIISCLAEHSELMSGFHEVRTRKAGNQRFIDFHLTMPKAVSVEQAHLMCDHLEQDLKQRLPTANITIHVEPCDGQCQQCSVTICTWRIETK